MSEVALAGEDQPDDDLLKKLAAKGLQRPDLPTLGAVILKPFGGLQGLAAEIHAEYGEAGKGSNNRALLLRAIVDILKISAAKTVTGDEFEGVPFSEMESAVRKLGKEGLPDAG